METKDIIVGGTYTVDQINQMALALGWVAQVPDPTFVADPATPDVVAQMVDNPVNDFDFCANVIKKVVADYVTGVLSNVANAATMATAIATQDATKTQIATAVDQALTVTVQ